MKTNRNKHNKLSLLAHIGHVGISACLWVLLSTVSLARSTESAGPAWKKGLRAEDPQITDKSDIKNAEGSYNRARVEYLKTVKAKKLVSKTEKDSLYQEMVGPSIERLYKAENSWLDRKVEYYKKKYSVERLFGDGVVGKILGIVAPEEKGKNGGSTLDSLDEDEGKFSGRSENFDRDTIKRKPASREAVVIESKGPKELFFKGNGGGKTAPPADSPSK